MLGSLQKDDDDEISNLVDLHMGMLGGGWQYLQSCRSTYGSTYGYAWWWMEMTRSSKLALMDHHKSVPTYLNGWKLERKQNSGTVAWFRRFHCKMEPASVPEGNWPTVTKSGFWDKKSYAIFKDYG
ncbi:hypothetical protein Tco_1410608 [Tanacetum coccineum]